MKKLVIIPVLMLLVFISGCTNSGNNTNNTSSSEALQIAAVRVDPSSGVYEGETVFIEVDVRNVGNNVVENVYPRVIGLPSSFTLQEQPDMLYSLEPSNYSEVLTWSYVPSALYSTMTYPFEVAIDYDYKTHSEAIIRVASRDWIRSLPQDQQQAEINSLGVKEQTPQKGPIKTTFKLSTRNPYAENGQATVYLEIENAGNGKAIDDEVFVTVASGDLVCDNVGTVKLVGGNKGQLKCIAYIGDVAEWKNIESSLEISYKYSIRSKSNEVKVFGKSEQNI